MAEQPDVAEILKNIQADVQTLVKGEIELVKAELVPQAKRAGVGVGLFGTAAYIAATGLTILFVGLSFLLSAGFEAWFSMPLLGAAALGFSTMAVLGFVVAGVVVLIGKQQMVFTKPDAAITQATESVAAIKQSATRAKASIDSLTWRGRATAPELE